MSFGMRVLLVSTLLLGILKVDGVANDSTPVTWSVKMGGTADSIIVTVLPHVRIKNVRCEIKLLDASQKQVGSFTARFADREDVTLAAGVEHSQAFTLDRSGVKDAVGLLLYARPVLSSPKASSGGSTEMLARGVPPQSSNQ